ncbi:hypothetical protein S7711_07486 [Stachybotrys chartarum IBT 7711]|uniref:Uncharacterized protein n=1 Tax=Stachybotrys chartarum (strain CBS 109288 / IBT 7711) TaxID=1280523 RepID=A0A084B7D0_STACB|nr:hypothetical protein S7711_07486 [Stachybotrys chartarum IBT 7711]
MHFHVFAALGMAAVATAQLSAVPIIRHIAPGTNCTDATSECRTPEQSAPWIAQSMADHGIYSVSQMAAVIALMAFESVDFTFKRNQFPGRPGQGTANMQMPAFNLEYAKSLDGVKDQVADMASVEGLTDEELDGILDLVVPDEYNFGSGAWFLTSECAPEVRAQLDENIDTGFDAYMACVGVEVTEDRLAYLERAKEAFGLV